MDDLAEHRRLLALELGYEPFVPTDEESEWIKQYGNVLGDASFRKPTFGLINSSAVGRALNREVVDKWNANRRFREESKFNPIGPVPGRRMNFNNPTSLTVLLRIVAKFPEKAYPLKSYKEWDLWLPTKFTNYRGCDVKISARCSDVGFTTMPLKGGEFITVHKICEACQRWFFANDAELVEHYQDELLGDLSIEPTNETRLSELIPAPGRPDLRVVEVWP
ncbi:Uncharacterised protein [Mycolicibacterium aurum]|uniref:Uncharacterized protein n=2 Tax=Mycolicibacterium aurum TaxID=1791 RepID=A0A448IXE8_MYCAU|nr:Uncharacterised protein [Mycolicibacterium aurum]